MSNSTSFLVHRFAKVSHAFCPKNAPRMVPIMRLMAAKISLLKLWRTRMYVASKMVRHVRAMKAKYMP